MDNLTERDRQARDLSRDILTLAKNSIILNLRFMDRAVGHIKLIPDMNYRFSGNGANIYYSPWTLIRSYREEPDSVARDLLHSVLHNVFRHHITGIGIDRIHWDLAADIAVENSINGLGQDFLMIRRAEKQAEIIDYLNGKLPALTAERIYSFLMSGEVSAADCLDWKDIFAADDHVLWYGQGAADLMIADDIDLDQLWEDIAKRMQTELEQMQSGGALTQNLREINRVRYDYTEFLKRFGRHSEVMRLSEEEFDNNYYTYGIELYGNIPLIEPLEYRDSRNIREFVIAIDTSGSVQGDVVQKFVEHTHDILVGTDALGSGTSMYILQCDDEIRDITHVTSKEEFEAYLRGMEIRGLGRTDFRPVFEYVNGLINERKLRDLRGLLYFTDGQGIFPEAAPGYDTAFIIHNDSLSDVWVPGWAMKVEMQSEEIMAL